MMKERDEEITIDLVELYYVLKNKVKIIGGVTAACALAGAAYLALTPKVYESSALFRLNVPVEVNTNVMMDKTRLMQHLIGTHGEIIKSRSVTGPVAKQIADLHDSVKYPGYDGNVAVTQVKNTDIMKVTVTGKTPEVAQKANEFIVENYIKRLQELTPIEKKTVTSSKEKGGAVIRKNETVADMEIPDLVQVIDKPSLQTAPTKPRKPMTMLISLLLGLIGSSGFIIAKELLNRKVKNTDDVEQYLELSVLGTVPDNSVDQMTVLEAYRNIRTNLLYSAKKKKKIVLPSVMENAGNVKIVQNLATVVAQAGFKVLVVDCNMRAPQNLFNLTDKGLSDVLVKGANVKNLLQASGVVNLDVLPAGSAQTNPSELLASPKMDALLAELQEAYDYLFLATPAVLPLTDAAIMATKADGVVLALESGKLAPDTAVEAKVKLAQVDAKILGIILDGVENQ